MISTNQPPSSEIQAYTHTRPYLNILPNDAQLFFSFEDWTGENNQPSLKGTFALVTVDAAYT